jgi:hypothetical protein
MNIDVIVAKLKRNGFTDARAEQFAGDLLKFAKDYGVNVYDLLDEITPDFKLNDLGEYITNNAVRQGYQTGKIRDTQPNKYVARAIIR